MLRYSSCRHAGCGYILSLAVAAFAALAAPAFAQSRERALYVSAIDSNGDPVANLTPNDVSVREDGRAREVLRVMPATDPMQVALLVDNTAASNSHVSNIRDGVSAFFKALGNGHEVSLVGYADRPTLLTDLTINPQELQKGVGRLFAQPNSGAYLMDAIEETSRGFTKRESPRPVIVVVGIEDVEFSNSGYEYVLDTLKASGAQLHVLMLVTPGKAARTQPERDRDVVIDRGTRETGGRRENLLSSMSYASALEKLAAELKGQYKVVYSRPDSLIPPRDLEIASTRPGVTVRGVPVREPKPAAR